MLLDINKNKYDISGDEYIKGNHYVLLGFVRYSKNIDFIKAGIAFVTKSDFIHTEIIYQDKDKLLMLSASQHTNRVRKKCHKLNKDWTYYRVKVDKDFIIRMKTFFNYVEGQKYDYMGILGFLLPTVDRSDRWFCSEFCSNVFKINGFKPMWFIEPSSVSPGILGSMFKLDNKLSRLKIIKIYLNKYRHS